MTRAVLEAAVAKALELTDEAHEAYRVALAEYNRADNAFEEARRRLAEARILERSAQRAAPTNNEGESQ